MKAENLLIAGAFAAVLSVVSPVVASAKDVLYDCSFAQMRSRGGGWVPEQMLLRHDPDTGGAEVIDPIIQHFTGAPIRAEVSTETAARIGFAWTLKAKDPANQQVGMRYRFTYFKDGRAAQISVQPGGFDNNWSGSGKCKVNAS